MNVSPKREREIRISTTTNHETRIRMNGRIVYRPTVKLTGDEGRTIEGADVDVEDTDVLP